MAALTSVPVSATGQGGRVRSSGWAQVQGPTLLGANGLFDVAAFGARDAWTVGVDGPFATPDERPLAAHWNGRDWERIESPGTVPLTDVSGTGGRDVWAVGAKVDGSATSVQHWNGDVWSEVDHVAATPGSPLTLTDVEAVGPADVWAVGFRGDLPAASGHVQRWDGTEWRETDVPRPEGVTTAVLSSVSSLGPTNVWAVGFGFDGTTTVPYFVRWNGSRWSLVDVPPSIVGGYSAVEVLGPTSVVAVGSSFSPGDPGPKPVIASLTGGVWRQDDVPVAGGELRDVSPDGAGGLWVVGDRVGAGHDDRTPLILRGQGSRWSVTPSPVTDAGGLAAVRTVPRTTAAWAVGSTGVTEETSRHFILGHGLGAH